MILALAATLAIVMQDHAALRAAPRTSGMELSRLWPGDVLEVRGERAGYLKVYDYRRERGGYVQADAARPFELTAAAAPDLLAVMRFLRQSPGLEALGISYGAAYLRVAAPQAVNAEPFDAIAQMAERLADRASGMAAHGVDVAPQLEGVEQFGVHMRNLESNGRMRVCYDGELFHRVLSYAHAPPEQRARAVLALTRADCIDPALGPAARSSVDEERSRLLEQVNDGDLNAMMRSRLHARRAGVWASVAFSQERHGESCEAAATRARAELLSVQADDLGEDRRPEYVDAVLRVSAIRWAGAAPGLQSGPLMISAMPADPGQTCVTLQDVRHPRDPAMIRRCTYGRVRMASLHAIIQGHAWVFAVQTLEGWRELWVLHANTTGWTIDVVSPGLDNPEEGYVEFAGFAPGSRRLLIAREVKDGARFRRSFEELRLDDLALVRQASRPELLRDFGRWQDPEWRQDTLAVR